MRASPAVLAALSCIVMVSCRTPTEITVDVRTDIPCLPPAQWKGIAVYAGAPGLDVETKAPSLTTTTCDASGHVGSVVIVPSADKNQAIAVRVVAGITRPPEECATHAYDGCVVARRQLSFIPHESLSLSIVLNGNCLSQGCDALHTCVRGTCNDSRVDGATAGDAGLTGPTVHCGSDESIRCPANDVHNACCVTEINPGLSTGVCVEASTCNKNVFLCEKNSDCAGSNDDAGQPHVCCVGDVNETPNTSSCQSIAACGTTSWMMCSDRKACLGGTLRCRVQDKLPASYFTCQLPP